MKKLISVIPLIILLSTSNAQALTENDASGASLLGSMIITLSPVVVSVKIIDSLDLKEGETTEVTVKNITGAINEPKQITLQIGDKTETFTTRDKNNNLKAGDVLIAKRNHNFLVLEKDKKVMAVISNDPNLLKQETLK